MCASISALSPISRCFRTAPFLAIEILSQDDRFSDLLEMLDDYRDFRIPFVWIIDPRTKRGYTYSLEDEFEAVQPGLRTRDPIMELPVERLFE
jgi:Uma2 family endonuclease